MKQGNANHDFRSFLQEEFSARARRNPRYSLRAFAKSLDIDPSELSKVMRGARTIGPRLIQTLGKNIGCSDVEILKFRKRTSSVRASTGAASPSAYKEIPLENFKVISNWYHFAI